MDNSNKEMEVTLKKIEEIRKGIVDELEKLQKIIQKRIEEMNKVDPDYISLIKNSDLKSRFRVREFENEMCNLVFFERHITKALNHFKQKSS